MALYAIGDLHLSLNGNKPMDIFGGWEDYVCRLEANWREVVNEDDRVVLVGDTSWAMTLEECRADFAFIQNLPGKKIIIKGNHDYWWSSRNKMEKALEEWGFDSLQILHNSCVIYEDAALCGTRGWVLEEGVPHDEKVLNREVGRLKMSLDAAVREAPGLERIVFLHYPPRLSGGAVCEELVRLMHEYDVERCYYGHLHGNAVPWAVQGRVDGVCYKLVSADSLSFMPYKVF